MNLGPKLTAMLCFAVSILSNEAVAQQNTLKQQLVGTWTVVSFTNENERTGKKTDVFGSDPKGIFMFDETGHFSINLLRPGRPKFGYRDFPPVRTAKAALEGIITMFGTYKVNEVEHSVFLDVIGGSYPTWDSSHQKRFITVNGDELTYRNPTPASGGGTAIVTLKRAGIAEK
jgi:Lipocalin-like domain